MCPIAQLVECLTPVEKAGDGVVLVCTRYKIPGDDCVAVEETV